MYLLTTGSYLWILAVLAGDLVCPDWLGSWVSRVAVAGSKVGGCTCCSCSLPATSFTTSCMHPAFPHSVQNVRCLSDADACSVNNDPYEE